MVVNSNPSITANSNSPVCQGSDINLGSTPSGGSGTYTTFGWSGPNSFTASTQNVVITNAASVNAGDYFITVTDNNGCSSDGTTVEAMDVNEKPTVSLAYNNPVCLNTSLVITATPSGGSGNYVNYVWTKGGIIIAGENSSTLNIDPAAAGDAGLYGVTVEDNSGCTSDESTLAVVIHSLPIVTAGNDGPVCAGGDVSLSGGPNGMVTYDWVGPNSFTGLGQNLVISPVSLAEAGSFTLTVTDVNGCKSATTTDVVVNEVSAAISVSAPTPGITTICAGTAVTFNAAGSEGSGTYTYDFHLVRGGSDTSKQNGSTVTYTTSTLEDGDEIYVVVNDVVNGCSHTSGSITMKVVSNPVPTLTITSPGGATICSGETIQFLATPGTFSRYVFMRNGTETLQDGALNTLDINTLNDGDKISVIAYAGTCFGNSTSTTISVHPLPTSDLAADKTTVCQNEVVTFTTTPGGTGPFQYQFYIDGVAQGVQGSNTFTHSSTVDFSVEAEVFDGNNCSVLSTPVDITISLPVAGLTADKTTICELEEVTFTATGGVSYEFFVNGISIQGPGAEAEYKTTTLADNDNVTVEVTNAIGCSASHAGILMTVNPIPVVSIGSSDADNIICAGDEITFTASGGDVFEWFIDGTSVQGPDGNNQFITTTLNDGEKVAARVSFSTSSCGSNTAEITATVNPLPVPTLNVSPSNTVISGTMLSFTAAGGTEYEFFVNGTVVQVKSETAVFSTDLLANGDVVSVYVYNGFDCSSSVNTTVTVLDGILPKAISTTATDYCNGDGGVSIYVEDPQHDITYELWRSSDDAQVGGSIMFNVLAPVAVQWDNVPGTDEYRVEAYYSAVPTERVEMNNGNRLTITNHPLPTVFNLTSPSSSSVTGCNEGAGHDVELSGSQTDFIYRLLINGVEAAQQTGTGSAISFTGNLVVGMYTIEAEDNISGCTQTMNGSFEILSDGSDVAFNLEVVSPADPSDLSDGRYCAGGTGVELQLDGSLDNTVNYKLYLDGAETGILVPGADGAAISFGTVATEGTYTVRVESASGCQFPMNGQADVSIVDLPASLNIITDNLIDNTNGHYCADDIGVNISVDGQEDGVEYSLLRDGLVMETVTGGSTPAAPLTFSGPFTTEGTYTVEAVVPLVGCTTPMANSIEVVVDALPTAYDAFNDVDAYCQGESTTIYILNSEADVEYTWEETTSGAQGSWQNGNNSRLDFTISATGDYIILARRTDGITSCSSVMNNGPFSITEKPLPVDVTLKLAEAGTGCDNGDSLYVESPEAGVTYALVKQVGVDYYPAVGIPNIVSADGTDIGFERVVDTNDAAYTVQAIKDGCSIYSSAPVVLVNVPGVIAKQLVTGSGAICNGDPGVIFGLADTEIGVDYELWKEGDLSPMQSVAGTDGAIEFGEAIEEGEYYVMGVNGICDMEMTNRVQLNVNPLPVAYSMFGSGQTCDLLMDGAMLGVVQSEADFTYRLQLDDGSGVLSIETSIPGRSDADSLKYKVNKEGTYSFMAISDKGCTSNMNGSVTVVEVSAPADQVIVPLTTNKYCSGSTGVELQLANNELDVTYQVRDASNHIMSEVIGTNTDISVPQILSFPDLLTAGTYSIWKSRGGDACIAQTNNNEEIIIVEETDPTSHSVVVDDASVCGATGTLMSIEDSETGRSYRIEADGIPVNDTISSAAGEPISWSINETVAGRVIYEVFAIAGTVCDKSMGTASVTYSESPSDFVVFTELDGTEGVIEYCAGTDSISIGVELTQDEVGYQLIDNLTGKTVDFISGSGNKEFFNNKYGVGSYSVKATLFTTGCSVNASVDIDIVQLELPDATYMLSCTSPDNEDCYVGDYVVMDGSEEGIEYQLYKGLDTSTPYSSVRNGDGNSIIFDDEEILTGGIYKVMASNPVTGCNVWVTEGINFYDSPLIARNDTISIEKGVLTGGDLLGANDITNEVIDILGESGDEGNLRFTLLEGFVDSLNNLILDEKGELVTTIGVARIDSVTGALTYEKLPSFYGLDSVRYMISNRDYAYRSDIATAYFYVGNKELDDDENFLIPNAFSPNGDSYNEYFKIVGINKNGVSAEKSSLEVFNRWGSLVYRSKGITYGEDNEWWDGTSTTSNMVSIGSDLPNGTYFYVFKVEVNIGDAIQTKEYNGYIELRR
ncbi:T9SS type B sorting domain-containing protein [Saccharicrinis sp. GN24d3]|uniref:T9SS type B sorting domain-containing protein n=1 Tax=Saccharicrinis sp. GN24d3 TaxID=3458416 RepID=UPI0040364298